MTTLAFCDICDWRDTFDDEDEALGEVQQHEHGAAFIKRDYEGDE